MSPWCRRWWSAPVLFPGKLYGGRSLAGYSPWGRKESDRTEHVHIFALQDSCNNQMAQCKYNTSLEVSTEEVTHASTPRHFSGTLLFAALCTITRQAPVSVGYSGLEYWSGLPCPLPGDLPKSGMESTSPALKVDSLPTESPGKPNHK